MAIGDIYEVAHIQEHEDTGEKIMSKWYFRSKDALGSAANLYQAFKQANGYLVRINELQSRVLNNVELRVINLFSLTDFFFGNPTGQGTIASDEMLPLHSALNITLKLNTRGIRPGSRRISGIDEASQSKGLITGAAYITSLNSTLVFLSNTLTNATTADTYDHVVVGRIKYDVPDTDSVREAYRLPANQGEANAGLVIAALANLRISHQVSRGNGR